MYIINWCFFFFFRCEDAGTGPLHPRLEAAICQHGLTFCAVSDLANMSFPKKLSWIIIFFFQVKPIIIVILRGKSHRAFWDHVTRILHLISYTYNFFFIQQIKYVIELILIIWDWISTACINNNLKLNIRS